MEVFKVKLIYLWGLYPKVSMAIVAAVSFILGAMIF